MFALGLHYLNGWSMAAADSASKEQAEWPPHPDRVFMALAAAWFETGENPAEGEALRWLESLPPPSIAASEATHRTTVTSYVPVNDGGGKKSSPKTELEKLKNKGLAKLPEYRLRQPRGFPVAIPHDPTVRMIWPDARPGTYRPALEQLASKLTHVGHSASFVQAWLEEDRDVTQRWVPTDNIADLRLRIPSAGRLNQLAQSCNRNEWFAYHDLHNEIERANTDLKTMKHPPRVAWQDFPNAIILANESQTKRHPKYHDAKTGDTTAAVNLVNDLLGETGIAGVKILISEFCNGDKPMLVSAHAREHEGVNAIPVALAEVLSKELGLEYESAIVQTNVVSHTGADGYGRMARQAHFDGELGKGNKPS